MDVRANEQRIIQVCL